MTTSRSAYQKFLICRFDPILPKQVRKSLQAASSPYKWSWNPKIQVCLFRQNSRERWLIMGYDYATKIVYAIRISWKGKVDRGVFSIEPLLRRRDVVRMENFKPGGWFQYRRREGI